MRFSKSWCELFAVRTCQQNGSGNAGPGSSLDPRNSIGRAIGARVLLDLLLTRNLKTARDSGTLNERLEHTGYGGEVLNAN